jgi:Mn-dependent DtxR family transcriptional regulator
LREIAIAPQFRQASGETELAGISDCLNEDETEKVAEIRGRYDVLVSFLHDMVGVSVETAKQDSCKMEHIVSEETLKKLKHLKWYQGRFPA